MPKAHPRKSEWQPAPGSQAEIILRIYSDFISGKAPSTIAKELTRDGILTPGGKTEWEKKVVLSILTNEKYKGAALLQKRYTVDFLQKKTKVNEGEVPQYYVENSHPAIIEPEEWDRVQIELARRKTSGKATIDTLRYVKKTLTDTDFIDEDIADCEREMDLLTEMIRQTVMQNASASVSEDEYRLVYSLKDGSEITVML